MKRKLGNIVAVLLVSIILLPMTANADVAAGKAIYERLCLSCHGAAGAGDGPVGASLPPAMKPRDLSTGQFKFSTDLAKFTKMIKEGGAAVGLNPMMAKQASLSDADIKNVYDYVQSLKK